MSHFSLLVILPRDYEIDGIDEAEETVMDLIEKYNEETGTDPKWDWFQIGARWTGALDGYDPEKDPKLKEVCHVCCGVGRDSKTAVAVQCRQCEGTGLKTKWPTQWPLHAGDCQLVENIKEGFVPFAVVTPDGAWHEAAQMGWFAITENRTMTHDQWAIRSQAIYKEYVGHQAVIVDCHI